jgi:type II secretory pathway component PulK
LIGRHKQSAESYEVANEYFEKLNSAISTDVRSKWNSEILDAENQRLQSPAAMDIMGTRNVAVSRDIQDVSDNEKDDVVGEWISLALSIEEKQ